jgi:hypothetical protein
VLDSVDPAVLVLDEPETERSAADMFLLMQDESSSAAQGRDPGESGSAGFVVSERIPMCTSLGEDDSEKILKSVEDQGDFMNCKSFSE